MSITSSQEIRARLIKEELAFYLEKAVEDAPKWEALRKRLGIDLVPATPQNIEDHAKMLWLEDRTGDAYPQYLESNLWLIIRRDIFVRDGRKCVRCGKPARIVHHRDYEYETMAGLNDRQLVTVCEKCHQVIHYLSPSQKRPQSEWDAVLKTKPKKTKRGLTRLDILKRLIHIEITEGVSDKEQGLIRHLEKEQGYERSQRAKLSVLRAQKKEKK